MRKGCRRSRRDTGRRSKHYRSACPYFTYSFNTSTHKRGMNPTHKLKCLCVHTGPNWWVHQATRGCRENHQDRRNQDYWAGPKDQRSGASAGLHGNGKGNFNITKITVSCLHFLHLMNIVIIFLQEKSQLQKKLQESEQRLRLLELTEKTDATVAKRYKQTPAFKDHNMSKWCF